MLKWLRKYNTFILVVGGCLLMVAFLLQGVLNDLSKRGLFGGTAFKIGSRKVTQEEFSKSGSEYYALSKIIPVQTFGGGENAEHWYLLTSEAERAGLVGGIRDGEDFMDELAMSMAQQQVQNSRQRDATMLEIYRSMMRSSMDMGLDRAASETRLTKDDLTKAFAKLRGAYRMRKAYFDSVEFSSRRLASVGRSKEDRVSLDYVLIPAEREMGGIPDPDEAAIKAHFEKFKDTPKGGGDFGIGYKLPPRVKVEWLELNKRMIADALSVDGIEVEKRFLSQYPDGKLPEGKTSEAEHARIESLVRNELADKVLKTADIVVRGELERPTRKLDRDGDYLKLPADWASLKPDLQRISEAVAARLKDQYKIIVPAPKVIIRAAGWIEQGEVAKLEGIGNANIRRGQNIRMFSELLFGVRELSDSGSSEFGTQVGVPYPEAIDNGVGNKYYFTVLDARKESAPDSIEEVRPDIVRNIKRLAAYERLKIAEPGLKSLAVSQGLDAIAKAPAGSPEVPTTVRPTTVSRRRAVVSLDPASEVLDTPAFRDAVMSATSNLDPMADLTKLDPAATTFSVPLDKALAICVYRAKKILPLTTETFRTGQNGLAAQAAQDEFGSDPESNPFGFDQMKQRLKVTDPEGKELKSDKKDKPKK